MTAEVMTIDNDNSDNLITMMIATTIIMVTIIVIMIVIATTTKVMTMIRAVYENYDDDLIEIFYGVIIDIFIDLFVV